MLHAMMHQPHQPHQRFPFNANANVFTPRNYQPMVPQQEYGMPQQYFQGHPVHQRGYPQQGYGPSSSNAYNAMYGQEDAGIDAFAQFGQQSQQYMPSKELCSLIQESNVHYLLSEIQVGCEQLISEEEDNAGMWRCAIRERFEDPKMTDEAKRIGVKLIVEMAYSMEPNQFRGTDPQNTYSNLLKMLSLEIKDFMRQAIIPVLGEFHMARKNLPEDSRVFLAVFYAEIFVKLSLENGSRIEKIGESLCDQIDEILKFRQQDAYMKCLLRTFKIAGAELDASEALRKRVDQILTFMGGFAKGAQQLGETVKAQIMSLIDCRQRGWDRAPAGIEVRSVAPQLPDDSFEDSTDNDLTEEERKFLESHMEEQDKKDSGECDPDDQEIMKEFGKFVKEELLMAEEMKTAEMMGGLSVQDSETPAKEEEKPAEEKTEEK